MPKEWLLYSPSKGTVFCFACRLFGDRINQQSHPMPSSNDAGYCDWEHANERLTEHEGSESHRKAMLAYIMHAADEGQIDSELKKSFDSQCEYWTEVLRRVVSVVKFLAERGLAVRGHSETFGRPDNGNEMDE